MKTSTIIEEFEESCKFYCNYHKVGKIETLRICGNLTQVFKRNLKSQREDIIKWAEKEIPKWMRTSVAHGEREETTARCFLEHLKREIKYDK